MLIGIFYISMCGLANFIAYSLINKREYLNVKLISCFVIGIMILLLLHSGIIFPKIHLNNDIFLLVPQMVLISMVLNLFGKRSIRKTKNSKRLSDQVKSISVKMQTFIFTKAVYILLFITQIMIAMVDF